MGKQMIAKRIHASCFSKVACAWTLYKHSIQVFASRASGRKECNKSPFMIPSSLTRLYCVSDPDVCHTYEKTEGVRVRSRCLLRALLPPLFVFFFANRPSFLTHMRVTGIISPHCSLYIRLHAQHLTPGSSPRPRGNSSQSRLIVRYPRRSLPRMKTRWLLAACCLEWGEGAASFEVSDVRRLREYRHDGCSEKYLLPTWRQRLAYLKECLSRTG